MMKKTAILIFASWASFACASTVTISGAPTGPSALNPTATAVLSAGSLVRVGTLLTVGDYNTFVEFGTTTVKTTAGKAGKVAGSVTATGAEATHDQFNNKFVYIWIYSGTPANPAVAGSANGDQGLFKSSFSYPVNDTGGVGDAVTPDNFSFTESINLPFLTQQAKYEATGNNLTGSATGGRWIMGTVPEPSTALFASLSILGLIVRRRK